MARREWDKIESGVVQKGTGKVVAENGGDRQIGR